MTNREDDAIELAYRRVGAGDPVLLLHGQGARGADFEYQTEELATTHEVVVPDLRGHGDSPVPRGPYTMEAMAADVARVHERLELAPCHVIGHSLGGCVGLMLALDHPACVRTLVVINATARMAPRGWSERIQRALLRASLRIMGMGAVARASARMHFPDPSQEEFRVRLRERLLATPAPGYRGAQAAVDRFDVSARLPEIEAPVLVISGSGDSLPLEDKREVAERVANGRLEILADSRHVSIWDRPDTLATLLLEFLAEA